MTQQDYDSFFNLIQALNTSINNGSYQSVRDLIDLDVLNEYKLKYELFKVKNNLNFIKELYESLKVVL